MRENAEQTRRLPERMDQNAEQALRLYERMDQRVTAVEGTVQQQGRHLQQIDHNVTALQETVQSEEATIVVDDNQVAKRPTGFDAGERLPGLNNVLPVPGQGGFKEKKDSFFNGKKVVVGKDFSCHARMDVVSFVEKFGGIAMKNVKVGYGEYRSLTWCII